MATNKNFDVDDQLAFDDFELDAMDADTPKGQVSRSKKIVSTLFRETSAGAARGIRDRLKSEFVETGERVDDIQQAYNEAKEAAGEISDKFQPIFTSLKRTTLNFMPLAKKLVPQKTYNRVFQWLKDNTPEEEETPEQIAARQRSEQIAASLEEIFKGQRDALETEIAHRMADRVDQNKKFRSNLILSNATAQGVRKVALFMQGPAIGYMKKSLELQYQQLFITKDIFKASAMTANILNAKLEEIKHNTSLPDSAKVNEGGFIRKAAKRVVRNSISSLGSSIVAGAKEKIMEQMKEFGSIAEMFEGASEAAGGLDPITRLQAIGAALGWGSKMLSGTALGKWLGDRADTVSDLDFHASGFIDSLWKKARDKARANRSGRDDTLLGRLFGSTIKDIEPQKKLENDDIKNPTKAISYDVSSKMALTKVIPRHLERIGDVVEAMGVRFGVDFKSTSKVYNAFTGDLSTKDELKQSAINFSYGTEEERRNRANTMMSKLNTAANVSSLHDRLDESYSKQKFQDNLAMFISNMALSGQDFDVGQIEELYQFVASGGKMPEDETKWVKNAFDKIPPVYRMKLIKFLYVATHEYSGARRNGVIADLDRAILTYAGSMDNVAFADFMTNTLGREAKGVSEIKVTDTGTYDITGRSSANIVYDEDEARRLDTDYVERERRAAKREYDSFKKDKDRAESEQTMKNRKALRASGGIFAMLEGSLNGEGVDILTRFVGSATNAAQHLQDRASQIQEKWGDYGKDKSLRMEITSIARQSNTLFRVTFTIYKKESDGKEEPYIEDGSFIVKCSKPVEAGSLPELKDVEKGFSRSYRQYAKLLDNSVWSNVRRKKDEIVKQKESFRTVDEESFTDENETFEGMHPLKLRESNSLSDENMRTQQETAIVNQVAAITGTKNAYKTGLRYQKAANTVSDKESFEREYNHLVREYQKPQTRYVGEGDDWSTEEYVPELTPQVVERLQKMARENIERSHTETEVDREREEIVKELTKINSATIDRITELRKNTPNGHNPGVLEAGMLDAARLYLQDTYIASHADKKDKFVEKFKNDGYTDEEAAAMADGAMRAEAKEYAQNNAVEFVYGHQKLARALLKKYTKERPDDLKSIRGKRYTLRQGQVDTLAGSDTSPHIDANAKTQFSLQDLANQRITTNLTRDNVRDLQMTGRTPDTMYYGTSVTGKLKAPDRKLSVSPLIDPIKAKANRERLERELAALLAISNHPTRLKKEELEAVTKRVDAIRHMLDYEAVAEAQQQQIAYTAEEQKDLIAKHKAQARRDMARDAKNAEKEAAELARRAQEQTDDDRIRQAIAEQNIGGNELRYKLGTNDEKIHFVPRGTEESSAPSDIDINSRIHELTQQYISEGYDPAVAFRKAEEEASKMRSASGEATLFNAKHRRYAKNKAVAIKNGVYERGGISILSNINSTTSKIYDLLSGWKKDKGSLISVSINAETLKNALSGLWGSVTDAAEKVKTKVSGMFSNISLPEGLGNLVDAGIEAFKTFREKTSEMVSNIGATASGVLKSLRDNLPQLKKRVRVNAKIALRKAKQKWKEGLVWIDGKWEEAKEFGIETWEQAAECAKGQWDKFLKKKDEAVDWLQGKYEYAKGKYGEYKKRFLGWKDDLKHRYEEKRDKIKNALFGNEKADADEKRVNELFEKYKKEGMEENEAYSKAIDDATAEARAGLIGQTGQKIRHAWTSFTDKIKGSQTMGGVIVRSVIDWAKDVIFMDIYKKDKVEPGKPLLSKKQQEDGVYFADGTKVERSTDIDKPVFDANKQTLISEDDLKEGLVTVENKPVSRTFIGKVADRLSGLVNGGLKNLIPNLWGLGKDAWGWLTGKVKTGTEKGKSFLGRIFGIDGSEFKDFHSAVIERLDNILSVLRGTPEYQVTQEGELVDGTEFHSKSGEKKHKARKANSRHNLHKFPSGKMPMRGISSMHFAKVSVTPSSGSRESYLSEIAEQLQHLTASIGNIEQGTISISDNQASIAEDTKTQTELQKEANKKITDADGDGYADGSIADQRATKERKDRELKERLAKEEEKRKEREAKLKEKQEQREYKKANGEGWGGKVKDWIDKIMPKQLRGLTSWKNIASRGKMMLMGYKLRSIGKSLSKGELIKRAIDEGYSPEDAKRYAETMEWDANALYNGKQRIVDTFNKGRNLLFGSADKNLSVQELYKKYRGEGLNAQEALAKAREIKQGGLIDKGKALWESDSAKKAREWLKSKTPKLGSITSKVGDIANKFGGQLGSYAKTAGNIASKLKSTALTKFASTKAGASIMGSLSTAGPGVLAKLGPLMANPYVLAGVAAAAAASGGIYGGIKGWKNAGKNWDLKEGQKATASQKLASALGGALTFGFGGKRATKLADKGLDFIGAKNIMRAFGGNGAMMEAKDIEAFQNKCRVHIEKGDKQYEKMLTRFNKAVSEEDWATARSISGNEVSIAKELGKASLKILSLVSPHVMMYRAGLAATKWLFGDRNKTAMTEKEIDQFTKKMTGRIEKGDKGAQRILNEFQKAVADENWVLARTLADKKLENRFSQLWHKAERSRLLRMTSVYGAALYITDLFNGKNRDNAPMKKKEIEDVVKRLSPLAAKSKKAQVLLDKFNEAVESEDWKKARALSGNKLEAAIVSDIKAVGKVAQKLGKLVNPFMWGMGDADKPLTEAEIKKTTSRFERKIEKGDKTAKRQLDMFADAIAQQQWARARNIADMKVDKPYVVRATKSIIGFYLGNQDKALSPAEIEKFRASMERKIKIGGPEGKRSELILDKFNDYVEDGNWKKARAISKMRHQGIHEKSIRAVGRAIDFLYIGSSNVPMSETEIREARTKLQDQITKGDKKAELIFEKFEDAVADENWKKARMLAKVKSKSFRQKVATAITNWALGSAEEMTDVEINKFTSDMQKIIAKGGKEGEAASKQLEMFERAVENKLWKKARAISKMKGENILTRVDSAIQNFHRKHKILSFIIDPFGFSKHGKGRYTVKDCSNIREEIEAKLDDGDYAPIWNKVLGMFDSFVESGNYTAAYNYADKALKASKKELKKIGIDARGADMAEEDLQLANRAKDIEANIRKSRSKINSLLHPIDHFKLGRLITRVQDMSMWSQDYFDEIELELKDIDEDAADTFENDYSSLDPEQKAVLQIARTAKKELTMIRNENLDRRPRIAKKAADLLAKLEANPAMYDKEQVLQVWEEYKALKKEAESEKSDDVKLSKIWKSLKGRSVDMAKKAWGNTVELVKKGWDNAVDLAKKGWNGAVDFAKKGWTKIASAFDKVKEFGSKLGNAFRTVFDAVRHPFVLIGNVIHRLGSWITNLKEAISSFSIKHPIDSSKRILNAVMGMRNGVFSGGASGGAGAMRSRTGELYRTGTLFRSASAEGLSPREMAESIKNHQYEAGVAYDTNGNIVNASAGDEGSVNIKGVRGGTIVHNHPDGSPITESDKIAAKKQGLREVIVASPNGISSTKFNSRFGDVLDEASRTLTHNKTFMQSYRSSKQAMANIGINAMAGVYNRLRTSVIQQNTPQQQVITTTGDNTLIASKLDTMIQLLQAVIMTTANAGNGYIQNVKNAKNEAIAMAAAYANTRIDTIANKDKPEPPLKPIEIDFNKYETASGNSFF